MKKSHCALVLGGYVNGYSIIQELYEKKVREIILFAYSRELASYSNKINKFVLIDKTPESLYREIEKLHQEYEKIIVFPTDDLQLENLHELYDKINSFCFLPFNPENLQEHLNKYAQYSFVRNWEFLILRRYTSKEKKIWKMSNLLSSRFY